MKLLLWIEPIYIRDSKVTYSWIATQYAQALVRLTRQVPEAAGSIRIFCNRATADLVQSQLKEALPEFLLPTAEEEECLERAQLPWREEGHARWVKHMAGELEYSDGYRVMLERVHRQFHFDTILHWGTSRIIRSFAEERGITPLFAELGPVRDPFIATGVIDTFGVNGDSCLATGNRNLLEGLSKRAAYREPARRGAHASVFQVPQVERDRYIVVPLQTADDANILLHHGGMRYAEQIELTVSRVVSRGWRCVIKTHPGSQFSEYNMHAEKNLLAALSDHDGVEVLTGKVAPRAYAKLLAAASGLVTFNSSAGCEASLLGTPVHVIAPAGYAPPESFISLDEVLAGAEAGDAWRCRMADLHDLLLDRYLMHIDDVFDLERVLTVARFWQDAQRLEPAGSSGPFTWLRRSLGKIRSSPESPFGLNLEKIC